MENKPLKRGLDFYSIKHGYYEVTKHVESNVIEVDGTYFVELLGVPESENNNKEEIKKWLEIGSKVKVIPRSMTDYDRLLFRCMAG